MAIALRSSSSARPPMDSLPEHLLQVCLGRLSWPQQALARCVSRHFYHLLSCDSTFHLRSHLGCSQPWLLVIGGIQEDGGGLLAEIFDFENHKWRPMPAFPPSSFFNFSCAVVGCNLYAVGGFVGLSDCTRTMPVFNLQKNTWKEVCQMQELREACACGVIGGCIYVAGGLCRLRHQQQRTNTAEVYFPDKNIWYTIASMSEARSCCVSAVVGEKLYVIGGWGRETILESVEVYDPALDTWVKKASMPETWILCGGASIDSNIYVIGSNRMEMDTVELAVYNTEADVWKLLGRIPFDKLVTGTKCSLWGCAVTASRGKVYVLGGASSYDGGGLNTFLIYDPAKHSWETMRQMRSRRHGCAAIVVNF